MQDEPTEMLVKYFLEIKKYVRIILILFFYRAFHFVSVITGEFTDKLPGD